MCATTLVEALDELVAPDRLVGALKEMVLCLRVVAPYAFVVGCCPDRAHAYSGWQPAVGKAGGEALEALVAPACCSARVEFDFFEGFFVPFVAFLHVLFDLLAGGCFAQGSIFVS
jgi:hypothetical protein